MGQSDRLEALYQLLSRLEAGWLADVAIPSTGTYFAYDPLPPRDFLAPLAVVETQAPGRRFFDVGCGMGTKLAFMHYLGWAVGGVDVYEQYIDVARRFVPEADLRTLNAFDLQSTEADVVYAYRPCRSDEHELALEHHLLSIMTSGTLLWLPCRVPSLPDLPAEHLGHQVWRVI